MSIYSFITREKFGDIIPPSFGGSDYVSINWVMPPPSRQSGGHINIFRFILGLEARGFDCRVVICNDGMLHPSVTDVDTLFNEINEWFGPFKGSVYRLEDMPAALVTMATGWQTAYAVNQFRSTIHKGYFVQDFEPSFYPSGAESCFAEQTYKFGFTGFTAGSWLADTLRSKYGMRTYPVSFSYDKTLYSRKKVIDPNVEHLLCYVRPETIRRGWELVNLALEIIHSKKPDVRFILVGGNVDTESLAYPTFNPGSVKVEELANLYSQCKAALILSCTNLSLLPLEVMACGVPVISNKGANAEWLLNQNIVTMSDLEPFAIAKSVLSVMNMSEEEYSDRIVRGLSFAKSTNWETEIDKIATVVKKMVKPIEVVAA